MTASLRDWKDACDSSAAVSQERRRKVRRRRLLTTVALGFFVALIAFAVAALLLGWLPLFS